MASSTKHKDKHKRRDGAAKGDRKRKDKSRSGGRGKAKGKASNGRAKKKDRRPTADTADRYDLYQRAVNSPETDVDFLVRTYSDLRGREPRHLREDFCGTSNLCAEFLSRSPENTAEGFDLDPEPVEWGKRHNFGRLADGHARMTWHLADVRDTADRAPDVTVAANFSYWIFGTRAELLGYFNSAREDLAKDGIFVIDLYGGPEALTEMEEVREIEDGAFDYIWDQRAWEPGTGRYSTAIHFRFHDGSELENAFTYEWRFWHLTELRDVLLDAGFTRVSSYFEGTDPEDETSGDGDFKPDPVGENCDAWIGYLVAEK